MFQQTTSREARDLDIKIAHQPAELEGNLKPTVVSLVFIELNALTTTSVVTELQTGHLVIL